MKRIVVIFLLLSNFYLTAFRQNARYQNQKNLHHVICSYAIQPQNKHDLARMNQSVHAATYEIKQYFKKKYSNSIIKNYSYQQHQDSVFFIHFDHEFGNWTLYKPSFVPFQEFTHQAQIIYQQYGVPVLFQKEETVYILQNEPGFEGEHITLEELELYKKMDYNFFDDEIIKLTNKPWKYKDGRNLKRLKKMKNMKKFFFWHLQIPTTGLLPGGNFDIDDQYKPIAWKFLLWDLAPKKGEGAKVAIIDTGVSAFNVKEKQFTDLYKKNINVYTPSNLQNYGYNLVSKDGLDPIKQIVINFGHYCDHLKFKSDELMKNMPNWIKDFIETKNETQLESYLTNNAKKELLDDSKGVLNAKGSEALQDLLYGKYGIIPKGSEKFFNIVNIEKPYNENILLETLPAPQLIGSADPLAAGHGTFTQGIISGQLHGDQGIIGFAPNAHVTMIKAFHDSGTTNRTTLNSALERARALQSSIVSMSLKITDSIDPVQDAPLKNLIDSFDYVVAASGNGGKEKKLQNKEAYPAKFDSVAFDVGAFKYDDEKYPICLFTQKELHVGPKFVAPGFDIFSAGLSSNQKTDSMYVFMSGTSVAVPIVTGFLALVLAEFQDTFTRQEILKVIYTFSIKLNNDTNWQQDIIFGTIDMRSCLLCLHVLQSIKLALEKNSTILYDYSSKFDNLISAIYTINYYIPSCYEQKLGYSLIHDFSHYAAATRLNNNEINQVEISELSSVCNETNLSGVIEAMKSMVIKNISREGKNNSDTCELNNKLYEILSKKNYNLFDHLPKIVHDRIKTVLLPKSKSNLSIN